jgi:hypothetical protein
LSPPIASSSLTAPDWEAIAQDYCKRILSVDELCVLHGISTDRLYRRITVEGWPRRRKPNKFSASRARASTESMPNRLLRALDMKMTELEKRMAATGEPLTAADCERNVRTLNTLVGLFEKLKNQAVADATGGRKSAGADGENRLLQDADELRRQLAERLQRLGRETGAEAPVGEGDAQD